MSTNAALRSGILGEAWLDRPKSEEARRRGDLSVGEIRSLPRSYMGWMLGECFIGATLTRGELTTFSAAHRLHTGLIGTVDTRIGFDTFRRRRNVVDLQISRLGN